MKNTVVGVYDSYAQAQNAMNELIASGFSPNDLQLRPDAQATTTQATATSERGTGIGHFFRALFGMDEDRSASDIYSEAVRRGSCVLTAHADSDERRDQAADIMNRFDPIDIDERAEHWRSHGWTGYDESAPMFTDSEIEKDRSVHGQDRGARATTGTQADTNAAPATQATGGQEQAPIPVVDEELRVGKRSAQRGGVRVYPHVTDKPAQEPAVSKTARSDYVDTRMASDDADYREHWQNAYGSSGGRYEDYDAAYRYGTTMASGERFKNYRWEDVEPDMRSAWESTHPESTWEQVKDAVRFGAERVTGRQQRH